MTVNPVSTMGQTATVKFGAFGSPYGYDPFYGRQSWGRGSYDDYQPRTYAGELSSYVGRKYHAEVNLRNFYNNYKPGDGYSEGNEKKLKSAALNYKEGYLGVSRHTPLSEAQIKQLGSIILDGKALEQKEMLGFRRPNPVARFFNPELTRDWDKKFNVFKDVLMTVIIEERTFTRNPDARLDESVWGELRDLFPDNREEKTAPSTPASSGNDKTDVDMGVWGQCIEGLDI